MGFTISIKDGDRTQIFRSETPLSGQEILSMSSRGASAGSVMAWRANRVLRSLSWVAEEDVDVELIDTSSFEGAEIYRSTLAFVAALAARRVAGRDFSVKYSMYDSYYCELDGADATPEIVADICAEMHRIADSDMPIGSTVVPLDKARALLEHQGSSDLASLLRWRAFDPVVLSRCGDFHAFFAFPLAPSASRVRDFALDAYERGFLLRFPSMTNGEIQPIEINHNLMRVFTEYSHWLDLLGVPTMASLHERVASGGAFELIMVSEALHNMALANIASEIASRPDIKIVCIAGPSSSGKTTSSKRLAIQLRVLGKNPIPIEMDNYYVDREKTPLDENGAYDFEALEALDIDLVNDQMAALFAGREVDMPKFDFISGKRTKGRKLRLKDDDILIIEGIHGMNDAVSKAVPREGKYKIFVSPFTGVNLDAYNRIGTTDTRLLRRLVRDSRTRGYDAQHTIRLWPSVVRGSHKYIFPYEEQADVLFNTSLAYEMSVLKTYAAPILRSVPEASHEYGEARRLLSLLSFVPSVPADDIPNTSIIREFIGGSCF